MKPVYSDVSWIDQWQQRQGTGASTLWTLAAPSIEESLAGVHSVTRHATGLVPANYEPRYAYPLVVWLADCDCPVDASLDHIAALSPQNYLGLAINEQSLAGESDNGSEPLDFLQQLAKVEQQVVNAVRAFREVVNIHSDRVFVAGSGDAGTRALLLALHQPEWFGGAAAFGGAFPRSADVLARRTALDQTRFWLGSPSLRTRWQSMLDVQDAARQLAELGADVTTSVRDADSIVSLPLLRDLDRWIIDGILAES